MWLLVITCVLCGAVSGCPDGWQKYPERRLCFRIVPEHADWYTARDKCQAMNGQLAVFMSPKDQEFFKARLPMHHNTTGEWDGVWIDGTDSENEGVWKLSSGQPISKSLSWFPGQPDNVGNNEDCLVAMTPFDRAGQLNDAPCNNLKGYICQSGDCVCTASGDPHYHRHDGGRIDYQGPCTYRLINASLESGDCGMIVNAKNRPHPNNNKVSLTKWIDVQMIPSVDTIRLGQGGEVFVNGNLTQPPVVTADYTITESGIWRIVTSTCNSSFTAEFNGASTARVSIPNEAGEGATGICGNCDGIDNDDLTKNGTDVRSYPQQVRSNMIGNSWWVQDPNETEAECMSNSTEPLCDNDIMEILSDEYHCGFMKKPSGPFADCLNENPDLVTGFFGDCLYDACALGEGQICDALASLFLACEDEEIDYTQEICQPNTTTSNPTTLPTSTETTTTTEPVTPTTSLTTTEPPTTTTEDIDECSTLEPPLCPNGGTCVNALGNYTCCPAGYIGPHCDQDIDECAGMNSQPCQNGGTCFNIAGNYYCVCPSTHYGRHCEHDFDECNGGNGPCQHGNCNNTDGGYSCSCENGWTGPDCNEDENECIGNPCQNDGTCVNTLGSFYCVCVPRWTGGTCSIDVDECDGGAAPCVNGGICTNNDGGYSCICPGGWTGIHCQTDINECDLVITCQNGAACYNLCGSYHCVCAVGWTGSNCSEDINECTDTPGLCQNNGTCNNTQGGYMCHCVDGFIGVHCENEACEPGQFSSVITGKCECCPPGYISTTGSATACIPCSNGMVPNGHGTKCVCCPLNTIALPGDSDCRPCSHGQTSNEEQTECIDVVDIIETDQSCQEHGESNKATDGKFNDLCHCSKIKSVEDPWWRAKLSGRHNVTSVVITNRPDCCQEQMCNTDVYVSDKKNKRGDLCGTVECPATNYDRFEVQCEAPIEGKYVTLVKDTLGAIKSMVVCEVDIIGEPTEGYIDEEQEVKENKGKRQNEICPAEFVDDNSLDDCNPNPCGPGESCIDKIGGYDCQEISTCPPATTEH